MWAMCALIPVCVCVLTAFKTNEEYAATSVLDMPQSFLNFDNFVTAFEKANMLRGFLNTGLVLIVVLTASIFMGSMLAYKEPVLKKRLAYSTVSQVSYVLFGLSVLQPQAFAGALSHVVFHSLIKNTLFLCAGAIIVITGSTKVREMRALGSAMPILLGCYTVVSLALVGIPPASGFVSKWYLATGALASETGIWTWLGPVVLLVSALLTAGYLLPLTIQGFFPGRDLKREEERDKNLGIWKESQTEPGCWMLVPIGIWTAGALLFGCFPGGLLDLIERIGAGVF